jgi:hypothetical protein
MGDRWSFVHDEARRPDQYVLRVVHGWSLTGVTGHVFAWQALEESVIEHWVPVDPAAEWVVRHRMTGCRKWLRGSYRSAVTHGFGAAFRDKDPVELRGRASDLPATTGACGPQPARVATWQAPTPRFFAELPREPHSLLERLRADSPHHPRTYGQRLRRVPRYIGPWVYARDALRCTTVPADVRAGLFRALCLLPETRVDEVATTLDRTPVLALTLEVSQLREQVFIDRDNGCYAGARTSVVAWNPVFRMRPGTVILDTACRTSVVDRAPN